MAVPVSGRSVCRPIGNDVIVEAGIGNVPQHEFVLLGTGTSVGVPTIGCSCKVCTSGDPKLYRTRASAVISAPAGQILIDTGPDLRQQFLREGFSHADALFITHAHADHIYGLDDVRIFAAYRGLEPLPLYCDPPVEDILRHAFRYIFDENVYRHSKAAVPTIEIRRIDRPRVTILDEEITPIPLKHGPTDVLGVRWRNLAYCTDVNHIPEESWPLLEDLDVLILDAVRMQPHPTHFGLLQALEVIDRLKPKRAYLTHISCRLDPDEAAQHLPDHVQLAWDGQRFDLDG